jgi:hypothetical protein
MDDEDMDASIHQGTNIEHCQQPPAPGRGKKPFSPTGFKGSTAPTTPPELSENKFLLF